MYLRNSVDPMSFRSNLIKAVLLILVASLVMIAAGCGDPAASEVEPKAQANSSPQAIVSSQNVPAASSTTASTATTGAANAPAPSSVNPNPFGSHAQARPMTQGAPDNSEVSVVLNDNVIRTRVFKSHPTLTKVEELTIPADSPTKTIKVYLKNGSVKEIPMGKIGDPMTEPAEKILAAVGSK